MFELNPFHLFGPSDHECKVILESAESMGYGEPKTTVSDMEYPCLLLASAKSVPSLKNNVKSIEKYLQRKPNHLQDLAFTLAQRREHLANRAFSVVGEDGNPSPFELSRTASSRVSFVFTGQGAQWPGMGKELMLASERFLNDIRSMDNVLRNLDCAPNWSIEGM